VPKCTSPPRYRKSEFPCNSAKFADFRTGTPATGCLRLSVFGKLAACRMVNHSRIRVFMHFPTGQPQVEHDIRSQTRRSTAFRRPAL
jgi:hypothetical protein